MSSPRLQLLLGGAITLVLGNWPARATSTGESLYQEATLRETGDRNPEAAIVLYQKVIEAEGGHGTYAERARYRLAFCEEALGREDDAKKEYRALQEKGQSADVRAAAIARLEAIHRAEAQVLVSTSSLTPIVQPPELSLLWLAHWTLSLSPGISIPVNNDILGGTLRRSATISIGALYHVTSHCSAGLDFGYSFGLGLDFPQEASSASPPNYKLKVFHSTPEAEWGRGVKIPWGEIRSYGSFGFGLYNLNVQALTSEGNLRVVVSDSRSYAGLHVGGGLLWMISPSFAVGPDFRYTRSFPVTQTSIT